MAYTNPRESVFNQPKPVVRLHADLLNAIAQGAEPYPIPSGRKYEYGTAGVSPADLFIWFQHTDSLPPHTVSNESV